MSYPSSVLAGGLSVLALAGLALTEPSLASQAQQAKSQPNVEVVFVLDTTGSMGGLINAAKQKIWAICNQIVSGKPTPAVKVGLLAYRDRGDQYVTKLHDLTENLDDVHANLMSFQAGGGGDTPESVNQAIHEAVTKFSWNKDKGTLRLIFLVGDAPPHMEYANDVKYPETCLLAVKNEIIINTVQCGNMQDTSKYWRDICRLAEGRYVQIDAQGGSVAVIATPFDKDLAILNEKLFNNTIIFGNAASQAANKKLAKGSGGKKGGGAINLGIAAAADRAAYFGQLGKGASYDLLQNIKDGKVKLETLKAEELPEEMRKMTLAEQKAHLEKMDKERQELNTQAADLAQKRNQYIAQKQKEAAANAQPDSYDGQVLQLLQLQATRNNVAYAIPKKKKGGGRI
jgi:Mg-chelatase subunit ChlD